MDTIIYSAQPWKNKNKLHIIDHTFLVWNAGNLTLLVWCLMLVVPVGPPLVALWGYYILLSAVLYHKHYIRVTGLIFPKNPNEFFFIFTIISLSLMESYGTILILLFDSNKIKAMSTVRVHPTPKICRIVVVD